MDGGSDVCSAYFVGRLLLGGLDLSSDMVILRSPHYHIPHPQAHHNHDDHQNQSSHLDHCNQISQTHAGTGITLLLVIASIFGCSHQSHFDHNDHHGNPRTQVLASLLLVSDQPGWAGAVFGWIFAGFLVAVIAVIIGRWEVTH